MAEEGEMSYEEYAVALEDQVKELQGKNTELTTGLASSKNIQPQDNLISLQLDTDALLTKLERFYRGEYLHTDPDTGDITWKTPTNKDQVPLNEYGVTFLMEVVTKYISKDTVLSNYKEERIYEIVADIGDELILAIYCNYEKIGMDTPFKKTKFRLLITTTLHIIESAYRRALDGNTFREINQARIVTQSDTIGRSPMAPQMMSKRRFSVMDPRTWGAR